jgi:hypothetical protein
MIVTTIEKKYAGTSLDARPVMNEIVFLFLLDNTITNPDTTKNIGTATNPSLTKPVNMPSFSLFNRLMYGCLRLVNHPCPPDKW